MNNDPAIQLLHIVYSIVLSLICVHHGQLQASHQLQEANKYYL